MNKWGGSEHNDDAELLLELIHGALQDDGYDVVEYGNTRTRTTAYGGMYVERDGLKFNISASIDGSGEE